MENASNGNTKVKINNRVITKTKLKMLKFVGINYKDCTDGSSRRGTETRTKLGKTCSAEEIRGKGEFPIRNKRGERLRQICSVHKNFERFPAEFMDNLHIPLSSRSSLKVTGQILVKYKFDAARFSPFWNEIVKNLREEDYITNLEMELLQMPKNTGTVPMLFLAKDIAGESDTQDELWDKISRDDYMQYAVEECFYTIKLILTSIFDKEGNEWVERIYDDIKASIVQRTIHFDFQLKKLSPVMQKVTALTGILKEGGSPELEIGSVKMCGCKGIR
ncbi:unnamed protein product [Lactuca saligna]|uniref:Callose synthase helical domain-containing protein n=1 Tax=Lactuca saligna TaxID=75948 RepID=A0AA36EBH5_LACSI|nr:unnamed protein product [Lactuca saligna]